MFYFILTKSFHQREDTPSHQSRPNGSHFLLISMHKEGWWTFSERGKKLGKEVLNNFPYQVTFYHKDIRNFKKIESNVNAAELHYPFQVFCKHLNANDFFNVLF